MAIDLRRRLADQPWARELADALLARLRPHILAGPRIPPPDPPSGWGHLALCGACQMRLDFDPDSPRRHRCRQCGWVGEGIPALDEAWVYQLNLAQIGWAEQAAVLGGARGDAGCLAYARAVLLGYARAYAGYREHGDRAGVGRLQPQSLCEAVWMLPAERTCAALLAAGALDAAQADEVRTRLFAPAIDLLRRQTCEVHNIHVWMAAAIWALAERCGSDADRAFAERVLARNLAQGLLPHGSWYEISPIYHAYTCEALLAYARAAHAAGRPCLADEALPVMLRAQLPLVMPDGHFALVNDGWTGNPLATKAGQYEVAEGLWGGFAGVLGAIYADGSTTRTGIEALLYGPDRIAAAPLAQPPLTVVDGIAVVRRPGITAWIKATPDAGGHDHPDKPALNLILDGSDLRAGDIGNPGYGSAYHGEWFKRTWGHNALLVDGVDASRAGAGIDRTIDRPEMAVVCASAGAAYPGVWIRRVVAVGDGWVLDWIHARGDRAHRWQHLFHVGGTLDAPGAPHAVLARRYAADERLLARGPWRGRWRSRTSDERLLVEALPPADGLVAAFTGPDLPTDRSRDCLVVEGGGERFDAQLLLWRGTRDDAPCPVGLVERGGDHLLLAIGGQRWRLAHSGEVRTG